MHKVRIRFAKKGDLKYISHLDLLRTFERALARAEIPVAFSEGFNPRPRVSLPAALPVGTEGQDEILDAELKEPWPPARVLEALRPALPPLLTAHGAESPGTDEQGGLFRCLYAVETRGGLPADLQGRIAAFFAAPRHEARREKEGAVQTVDIRPFVENARAEGGRLLLELLSTPAGAARPDEVASAMGIAREEIRRIVRTTVIPVRRG